MRSLANRLKVNNLYVLGAGASFAASTYGNGTSRSVAPLDKHLTSRLLSIPSGRNRQVRDAIQSLRDSWRGERTFESYGLEAAIIEQLGSHTFTSAIHKQRLRRGELPNIDFLDTIGHLIAFVLYRARENNDRLMRELFDHIIELDGFAEDDGQESRERVITFNYDTLLDEHFLDHFSPQELYFDKIRNSPDESRRTAFYPHPKILKLHGSLNWVCSYENFRSFFLSQNPDDDNESYIDPIWFNSDQPPSLDDDDSPCIIPPTPYKPITQVSLFRFLWTTAYEYCTQARRIIICGYSLPDTDIMAKLLFREFTNRTLREVIIINPDASNFVKWKRILSRSNARPARWKYFEHLSDYLKSDIDYYFD